MNKQQKFIKYLATALAILLTIAIIGGIVTGVMFLTGVFPIGSSHRQEAVAGEDLNDDFGDEDSGFFGGIINSIIDSATTGRGDITVSDGHGNTRNLTAEDFSSRSFRFQNIENIDLDSSFYSIYFSTDDIDEVLVELTNVYNDYIVEQDGTTLSLEEPDVRFANFGLNRLFDLLDNVGRTKEASIRITVPRDFSAQEVEIDGGIGNIDIQDLIAQSLNIDAGVGNIKGSGITASIVDIDGGTGNIKFNACAFGNTDIDAGVGDITFHGTLHGLVSVDCGVGNTTLSLSDARSNYHISLDKGLGTVKLDSSKVKFDGTYEENTAAPYSLDISGGVGNITIDFAD